MELNVYLIMEVNLQYDFHFLFSTQFITTLSFLTILIYKYFILN
nr:MAG TPA: hypothetical protein [Caudoviricetes sp.]